MKDEALHPVPGDVQLLLRHSYPGASLRGESPALRGHIEDLKMTTKEQAKQIADALLAAAEAERVAAVEQSTRPLVRTYPALKHVPALERHAALREAREYAAAHASSRLFLALIALAIAAVAALGFLELFNWAIAAGIVVMGLLIARQFAELSVMRKYLASRFDIPNASEDHR